MVVLSGESSGRNDFVSLTEMQELGTLTSPPSLSSSSYHPVELVPQPIIPLEIVEEILCKLSVKRLSQLRCVCKSWNSLISDPKFTKNHLGYSRKDFTRSHLMLNIRNSSDEYSLLDYSLPSLLNEVAPAITELRYPLINQENFHLIVGSCDGLLYLTTTHSFFVWNPSIQTFKILPHREIAPQGRIEHIMWHGFGYDHLSDSYKVVSIYCYKCDDMGHRNQVHVHTLGTDSWRRIQDFPYTVLLNMCAKFVSGTLNWLVLSANYSRNIVSFDLGKETYQEIVQPEYGEISVVTQSLTVLRECLCIIAHTVTISDIWLMKEYGDKESWTKFFRISIEGPMDYLFTKVIDIFEDEEVLLDYKHKVVVYNPKHDTFKTLFQYEGVMTPWVYVESLIEP